MQFIRKNARVEAMQWDGQNATAIANWLQGGWKPGGMWMKQKVVGDPDPGAKMRPHEVVWSIVIPTNNGTDQCEVFQNDWIVKGHMRFGQGEIVIMTSENFEDLYDPV